MEEDTAFWDTINWYSKKDLIVLNLGERVTKLKTYDGKLLSEYVLIVSVSLSYFTKVLVLFLRVKVVDLEYTWGWDFISSLFKFTNLYRLCFFYHFFSRSLDGLWLNYLSSFILCLNILYLSSELLDVANLFVYMSALIVEKVSKLLEVFG
jgi:hypothetical protein